MLQLKKRREKWMKTRGAGYSLKRLLHVLQYLFLWQKFQAFSTMKHLLIDFETQYLRKAVVK